MKKLLSSVYLVLGLIFHVFPLLAAESRQSLDSQDSFISPEIDCHINSLMFFVFEMKSDVDENSILRTKKPAEIALFLKNIKSVVPMVYFKEPQKSQQMLMKYGPKGNLRKKDIVNDLLFDVLDHALCWGYTVSLKIEYGIIPNHLFDRMDQLHYLELNTPIIAADKNCADCLTENLRTNTTLKFLFLEYPLLFTGMGENHVSPYFDGIQILSNKDIIAELATALNVNKTLTSFRIDAGLSDKDADILECALINHSSIKLWSV